jgi:alkylation response protein AidB-like acyl-CoA dehydrogenase
MCWDFETETEFQEKLDWMTTFMKKDVWPLEVLVDEFDGDRFFRVVWSLQDEVKKRGLWATHLPPELGGQGMGQLKLGLMHEIEGTSFWGPIVFGNNAPDTGNSEVLHSSVLRSKRSCHGRVGPFTDCPDDEHLHARLARTQTGCCKTNERPDARALASGAASALATPRSCPQRTFRLRSF